MFDDKFHAVEINTYTVTVRGVRYTVTTNLKPAHFTSRRLFKTEQSLINFLTSISQEGRSSDGQRPAL